MTQNRINYNPTQYYTLVGSTNGNITNVAPGTATQVLTSNGTSSDPSYQAVPSLSLSVVVQTFTSSGTYTPTAGMRWCNVSVLGGGGAGHAGIATNGNAGSAIGGAGAGGGFAKGIFYNTTIGTSQVVTIGAGAIASSGGTSSLGSLISSTGGSQGAVATSFNPVGITGCVSGGTGTGGQLQFVGGSGGVGVLAAPAIFETNGLNIGSNGGTGTYGGNAQGSILIDTTGSSGGGQAGVNYGSGGSGGRSMNSAGVGVSATGSSGIITITEWIFS